MDPLLGQDSAEETEGVTGNIDIIPAYHGSKVGVQLCTQMLCVVANGVTLLSINYKI